MLTKETLLHSTKDLFYKYGIKSVSMDDIANLLGISKKTIYTFVSNKKELVHSVIKAFIKEEQKAVAKINSTSDNAIDEMTSIAIYVLQSLKSVKPTLSYDLKKYHPEAWKLIEVDHFDHIQNIIKNNIQRGINEGYYRKEINVDIYSKLYIGMSRVMVDIDKFPPENYAIGDLYENIVLYHLHGIMNENGKNTFTNYLKKIQA